MCAGSIGAGLVVLIGVGQGDTKSLADAMVTKLLGLRIFSDAEGKMNRSVTEVAGDVLLISQFTLYANCRRGRRPAFTSAAPPDIANAIYLHIISTVSQSGLPVAQGVFGADMKVSLVNDGPVTIMLDSETLFA